MPDPLDTLAARAAGEPFFLAWLLAAYADSEGLDDAGLAAVLGCPVQELAMLRLCRAPRPEPREGWEDITCIADRFGLDPQRLADAVKRGQVVRVFERSKQAAAGSLLAARDREDPPAPPPEGS